VIVAEPNALQILILLEMEISL